MEIFCSEIRNKNLAHQLLFYRHNDTIIFSRLMTYIYIYIYMSYRTANLQLLHFIYLLNKYKY